MQVCYESDHDELMDAVLFELQIQIWRQCRLPSINFMARLTSFGAVFVDRQAELVHRPNFLRLSGTY